MSGPQYLAAFGGGALWVLSMFRELPVTISLGLLKELQGVSGASGTPISCTVKLQGGSLLNFSTVQRAKGSK